jgi:hypothetical protein
LETNDQSSFGSDLIYEGPTINGKKEGAGALKNRQGEKVYEGSFKDDLYHGEGTQLDNGFIFRGSFSLGKKSAFGTIFSQDNKYKYEGNWEEDMKSGHGSETYPDGSHYIGEFKNNKKHGKGKKIFYENRTL